MKIAEAIEQVQEIAGQQVTLRGTLTVYPNDDRRIAYLVESNTTDQPAARIRIGHSFAELRRMIQPLHTAQIASRGQHPQLVALYALPVEISATISLDDKQQPLLSSILSIQAQFPLPGKAAQTLEKQHYHYSAEIEYRHTGNAPHHSGARAHIRSRRLLELLPTAEKTLILEPDGYHNAHRLSGKLLSLQGTLTFLPGLQPYEYHFVFQTTALRTTRLRLGMKTEPTPIWLRPSSLDRVLLTQLERPQSSNPPQQPAQIRGEFHLLQNEFAPILTDNPPRLVFSRLNEITLFSETYLR